MRSNEYYPGQEIRISPTFTDLTNTPADPDTVTISVKSPSGEITAYVYGTDEELVKDEGTGLYHLDYTPDTDGTWYYRVVSTGAVAAAKEGSFVVLESQF